MHEVVPQTYAPQDFSGELQVPVPVHVPRVSSLPAVQLGVPHDVDVGGYVHALPLMPSQRKPQVPPAPPQAVRPPSGAPSTLLQVPTEPVVLHAWH